MRVKIILLLCFLLGLTFALPIHAARLAPGSVPETRPLQPLPADVAPNFSENIESGKEQVESLPASREPTGPTMEKIPTGERAREGNSKSSLVWLVALLTGCALGYAVYLFSKKQKREKK